MHLWLSSQEWQLGDSWDVAKQLRLCKKKQKKHLYYLCAALTMHSSSSRGEISVPAYTAQD